MNITALNSYNYTSFTARKRGAHEKVKESNVASAGKTAGKIGLGLGGAAVLLGAVLGVGPKTETPEVTQPTTPPAIISQQNDSTKPTNPSVSYDIKLISTRPIQERTAQYHVVKSGDRLADIVKHYAQLDPNTPDEELIPYYELLEADNPNKWSNRNTILLDSRIRVDSITPENIVIKWVDISGNERPEETTEPTETMPTEPEYETSEEDTIELNSLVFRFDLCTHDKNFMGHEGLIKGHFVNIDKKLGGDIIVTTYEGASDKTNVLQAATYDEDGKMTELYEYKDGLLSTKTTFTYKTDTRIETTTDLTAKRKQLDTTVTTIDNKTDEILVQEFQVDNKVVAKFDFTTETVQIGEYSWTLDESTFTYNPNKIGSQRYCGMINGQEVRFDVLKNGYCVEYIDENGEITARNQFDAKGELIFEE